MDMDFKPVSNPPGPGPQAPLVTPTPPVQEDPFKPDVPVTPTPPPAKAKKGGHKFLKALLMIFVVLALAGAAGYGVFYWQHQHVDRLIAQRGELESQITDLQTQNAALKADNDKLTKDTTQPTADELVIKSTTAYCQAQVDPTTAKALVYTQGTSGTDKKKVLYSTDKNYASVTATCATTANAANASKTYYLKQADGNWVVLYGGTATDPAMVKLYNIPPVTEFK